MLGSITSATHKTITHARTHGLLPGYIVSELPGPMFKDIDVPRGLRCGPLRDRSVVSCSGPARVLLGSCSGPVHHQLRLQLLGSKELETVAVAVRKRIFTGHLSSHLLLLFSILP